MIMDPAGPETKNDYAGEDQYQFTRKGNQILKRLRLKMVTAAFAERLEYPQASTQHIPEILYHYISASRCIDLPFTVDFLFPSIMQQLN
jgi:hypothetical protein